jgi:ABC-2 type transport system ATP-binding protein
MPPKLQGVSAEPAVEVVDLVKRYRERTVVDGLSFAAAPGQVTAVLGPNGAGKTTTIECCEGLRRPDGGSVRVLGGDPARPDPQLRARIGVMLQEGGLPPAARTRDLLATLARFYRQPLEVDQLLGWLGLTECARTAVRRLSGGQRQRLALAAAVIGRPAVAFLDEPTAGLDPHARIAVWDLIGRMRADGVAVVLTTHLMDEAERLADALVVIDGGRVVAAGSPRDLLGPDAGALGFEGPAGLDLTTLHAVLPSAVAVVELAPGRYEATAEDGACIDVHVLAAITTWCSRTGIDVRGLSLRNRTLEDVFLQLTGRTLR